MSSILLHQPLGLGDHVVCNGLIREYCKKYDRVGLFCFPFYRDSVSFMFRDVPNLYLETTRSHKETKRFLLRNALHLTARHYDESKMIGAYSQETGVQYQQQFYKMAGLPFSTMYDKFVVERDREREQALYTKISPPERYLFVHDDERFPIDPARISSSLPIIRANMKVTDTIFDYGTVIERASEIHVIDSVFMFIVDFLFPARPDQKLFVHRYNRSNSPWNLPVLQKKWEILW
jgi:hypothetical protein